MHTLSLRRCTIDTWLLADRASSQTWLALHATNSTSIQNVKMFVTIKNVSYKEKDTLPYHAIKWNDLATLILVKSSLGKNHSLKQWQADGITHLTVQFDLPVIIFVQAPNVVFTWPNVREIPNLIWKDFIVNFIVLLLVCFNAIFCNCSV